MVRSRLLILSSSDYFFFLKDHVFLVNYDLLPIMRLLRSLLSPVTLGLIFLYDLRASRKACLITL